MNYYQIKKKKLFVKSLLEEVIEEEAADEQEGQKTIILAKNHPPMDSYEEYYDLIDSALCYQIFLAMTINWPASCLPLVQKVAIVRGECRYGMTTRHS